MTDRTPPPGIEESLGRLDGAPKDRKPPPGADELFGQIPPPPPPPPPSMWQRMGTALRDLAASDASKPTTTSPGEVRGLSDDMTDAAMPREAAPTPQRAVPRNDYAERGVSGVLADIRANNAAREQRMDPLAPVMAAAAAQPTTPEFMKPGAGEAMSVSPERAAQLQQQHAYRTGQGAPSATPFTPAQDMQADIREATRNPVARGAVAGFAQLGQTGIGAVRLAADLVGATDVADFASRTSRTAGIIGDQTGDLRGNDKLVADVTSSILTSTPAIAVGTLGGPALTTLFGQSTLAEYNAGRDAGFDVGSSLTRAGIMGTAEAIGERFGLTEQVKLIKGAAKGLPSGEVARLFGGMLTKEIPGEQLTTVVQGLADKFGPAALRPGASVADFLEAAGETLKVTVAQTAVMGGAPALASTAREQAQRADTAISRSAMTQAERIAADHPLTGFYSRQPAGDPLPPSKARTEALRRFDEMAAQFGLSEAATKRARDAAAGLPAPDVPGFLAKLTEAYAKRGLFRRPPDQQGMADLGRVLGDQPDTPPPAPAAAADPVPAPAAPVIATPIDEAAHQAATSPTNDLPEPTEAQAAAGNYAKGHLRLHGLDISVENPAGSTRRGVGPDGTPWENTLQSHYGYIRGTKAVDGDQVDVFIGPNPESTRVFVVDQVDPATGKFDEPKALMGFDSLDEARAGYQANYAAGWRGLGSITELPMEAFKSWAKDGTKRKPLGDLGEYQPDLAVPAPQPVAAPAGRGDQPRGSGGPVGPVAPDAGGRAVAPSAAAPAPSVRPAASVAAGRAADDTPVGRVLARAGRTPKDTEDIVLRTNPDGTLTPVMGGREMLDYDSGNPIVLPGGVDDLTAKKAIRDAGAVSSRINFFAPDKAAKAQDAAAPAESAPGSSGSSGDTKPPEAAAPQAARAPAPPAARKPVTAIRGSNALGAISRALGGISPDLMADLSERVTRTRTSKSGKKSSYVTWDNPPHAGHGPLFRAGGTADLGEIARVLEEQGYLPVGLVASDPLEAVRRAQDIVRAELKQGGATLREGDADAVEAEARRRLEAAMDAYEEQGVSPEGLEAAGYLGADDAVQAAVDDIVAAAVDAQSEQAIEDFWSSVAELEQQGERDGAQAEAQADPERGEGDSKPARPVARATEEGRERGQVDRQPDQGKAPELTLTAPSAADLEAEQARATAAAKTDTAEQKRLADKAKADAERGEFTLTGSDRPADVAAAAGQGDIFSAPAEATRPSSIRPESNDSEAIKAAKADALKALGDLADIFGKSGKAFMMPEQEQKLLPVLTRLMDAAFRLGYLKFKQAAKFALDQIRAALGDEAADAVTLEHLQGAYLGMSGRYKDKGAEGIAAVGAVSSKADIEASTASADTSSQEPDRVPSPDANLERDRPDTEPGDAAVAPPVRADRGEAAGGARADGGRPGEQGSRPPNDPGVPAGGTTSRGERGDQQLRGADRADRPAEFDAGADQPQRGLDLGQQRVPPETVAADQVARAADRSVGDSKKRAAQRAAESIPVKSGDLENIRATLPYLLPEQQDDVFKAEQRLGKPDGYGMLFTNGTGTGKTFTGLGVIKRFQRQGKTNTLIVVPDAKIMADWVESAKPLGLTVTPLRDTKDAGDGIVITTYANLGDNDTLARRDWDLIVPDEAHMLMQAADGKDTKALDALRAISLHPRGTIDRYSMLHRDDIKEAKRLSDQITANSKLINRDDTMDQVADSLRAENKKLDTKLNALNAKLNAARKAVEADVAKRQGAGRTRVVGLSATPFAYEFTVDWAEGYLFDYAEGYPYDATSLAYNQPGPRDYFFMTRFGYSMRVNKLTKPDAKVDSGALQRQFNAWLKKTGALSGRALEVEADYDRKFVLVDSAVGNDIDRALNWLSEKSGEERAANRDREDDEQQEGFQLVAASVNDQLYSEQGHLVRRYLLEAIKAKEVIPIIRQHLKLGRKVVVFHDFKKGGALNPFALDALGEYLPLPATASKYERDERAKAERKRVSYNAALDAFRQQFPGLTQGDSLKGLISPIQRFTQEFSDVLLINGDEKPRDLLERYRKFNDDDVGPVVALVQSAKNKGWSGHDTTGKHQRVLINLGLPTQPTTSIQQEGRIYRTGQVSDAIMRYLNTGTNWEKWAFAQTIARRASTAENLGAGEQARALLDSFVAAFEESDSYPPGHEGEGKGGKERDRQMAGTITEFDRAKGLYWGTQKKNAKTKAQEGTDYFATPEPVGLKMVQWLDLQGGEAALEPSAGHGAIARWFPDSTERTAVEPSMALRARLALGFDGKIDDGRFEDLHVVNKFDGIAMNPPFGTAGRTAIDHLAKAATHLRDGGRIVALIPTGPAADKKFDAWFYEEQQRPTKPLGTFKIGGKDVAVYKGDEVQSRASWAPPGIVTGTRDGGLMVKALAPEFRGAVTLITPESIVRHETSGKRTESYRPAEGLHLIASVKLPSVTFERAGTGVATRIVVIEKQTDAAKAPASGLYNRDLSGIEDINELFDRLENMEMPKRPPKEQQAAAPAPAPTQQAAAPAITIPRGDLPIVEHTTGKGKVLRGVVRTDLSQAQAKEIDAFTFKKDGGWFIREKYLSGGTAFNRSAAVQSAMPREAVQRVVSAITGAWRNGPRVVILDSMAEAPQVVRDALDAQQDAQGEPTAFVAQGDNSTVYLLLSQMDSPTTVASALYHEALGHIGLRNAFPELNKVLRQVAASLPDQIKAKAAKYGFDLTKEGDRLMAAEEVLAEIAETRPTSTWVQRAIATIRAALRKIPGLENLALTDSEIIVRFIEPARRFVEKGPSQTAAAPLVARPAFQRTRAQPAPATPTDGGAWTRTKARAAAALSPERVDTMIYTLQDRFIDLKRVEARIKELGGSVDEAYDAYLGEEMFHGRLAKRVQDFQRDEVKPLVKAMAARGVSIDELEQYLHARHAPERNAEMAKRNPNAAQLGELVNAAQRTLSETEQALAKAERTGTATAALKRAVTMARNELERYRGAQPWAGSEEDRLALSGMSDAEAAAIVDGLAPEKRADMEALAERIDAMARGTRQAWVDYGLEKRSTVGAMERTYQHYVPLFRDEAGSDNFPAHPIGSGFSTRGPASKRAMGSTKAVSNIIGHLVMQREAALTRGEKNRVAQQFYTLAAVNPNPDWWTLKSRATVRFINERTGLVEERPDPQWAQQPNVFVARFDGEDHYVVMNEDNPQAVRLAGALKNLDMADLGAFMNKIATITRYFASINTQFNPVFGMVNLTRDVQAAALNLSSTPLAGKQAELAKGVGPALRAIYREERGKAPTNQAWTDLWEQFQQDGGKTGFRDLFRTADERTKALQKELDALDRGMAGKAAHAVLDWLTHYNDAIENSLRLSAYKVALDAGMSRQQAASLAKNLTVNFNRKGKIARETGALYAFFNAAVQGTDRMAKTLAGPRGRAIVAGGIAIGVLSEIIGRGLMGDDEWDKIPEFVKERALVIPTGPTSYASIPMPLGLHVLPNLGRLTAEAAMSSSATVAGKAGEMMSVMVEAFNPIGTSATVAQTLAPTVADPFVALWENRDWTGRKIAIPNMSELDRQPGHQRAKDSASSFSMGISKALNRITGGDEFIPGAVSWSPDQIDYVIGTLTGGLGRELMKVQQTVTAPILGNELPLNRVPVVSRFIGSTEGVSGNSELFYRNLERVYSAENQHRGLARSQRGSEAEAWAAQHPEALMGGEGRKMQRLIGVLRDQRAQLQKDQPEGWRDEVAEKQRLIGEAMTRFNRNVAARTRVETAESVP